MYRVNQIDATGTIYQHQAESLYAAIERAAKIDALVAVHGKPGAMTMVVPAL